MMSKKSLTRIFVGLGLLLLVVIVIRLWYDFYDISGLKMYRDEPIRDIYVFGDAMLGNALIVTEDGRGYMTGNQGKSGSRTYRNTESHSNKYLHKAAVEVYDGKDGGIQSALPSSSDAMLFVTDRGVLYLVADFNAVGRLGENIAYAAYDDTADTVYIIDIDGKVHAMDVCDLHAPKSTPIWDGKAISLAAWNDRLFILTEEGHICKWMFENAVLSAPIFSDVREFSITDSHYYDEQQEPIECALMTVCKKDGTLYMCGTLCEAPKFGTTVSYTIEEPTLIGEDVRAFSTSRMGCVMLHSDSRITYFGLYTEEGQTTGEIDQITLPVQNAMTVDTADEAYVCVKTADGFYMWSEAEIMFDKYYINSQHYFYHSIWSGEPFVMVTP